MFQIDFAELKAAAHPISWRAIFAILV